MERDERASVLAQEVIALAQSTLMVHLRFLDRALACLKPVSHKQLWLASDGLHLYYEPWYVLGKYKWEQNAINRALLHTLLHCVFRHGFIGKEIDRPRWDLACDIAVENVITELGLKAVTTNRERQQAQYIAAIKKELKHVTAEKIYSYLRQSLSDPKKVAEIRGLFYADNRASFWAGSRHRER